jgi:hypothetical protein
VNDQWITEEIRQDSQQLLEANENETTKYQQSLAYAKAALNESL